MSKIFDALKKAKNEQAEMLFRPSNSKESVARAPKQFNTRPQADTVKSENGGNSNSTANLSSNNVIANNISAGNITDSSVVNNNATTNSAPVLTMPNRQLVPPSSAPVRTGDGNHLKFTLPKRSNLVAIGDRSLASEQFAGLRAKLMVMHREQNIQTICITSSVMGEGKTFVSTNLAITLAAESERGGILIDCDLRNPSVHRALGIRDATGLADYLQSDRENIDNIIIDTDHRLSVIPAGRIPKNPLALLDSDKLKNLIAYLRDRYDFIIIDAPPTAPLPDSDLLASLADGLLFVIRANQTPLTIIQRSLKMLNKRTIIGTVLNGAAEMPNYSYYYTYGQRQDGRYPN